MKTLLCNPAPQRGAQLTYSSHLHSSTHQTGDRQSAAPESPHPTLVVIDPRVEDYNSLITGVSPEAWTVVLNPHRDGIIQITAILKLLPNVDLHILCHGAPGQLQLGSTPITQPVLAHHQNVLRTWFNGERSPSITLYSCSLAATETGADFIATLHHLTGATVHASTTPVGNAALGGNWQLDAMAPSRASSGGIMSAGSERRPLQTPFHPQTLAAYASILMVDTDGDGIDDAIDIDDDNDGIIDAVEDANAVQNLIDRDARSFTVSGTFQTSSGTTNQTVGSIAVYTLLDESGTNTAYLRATVTDIVSNTGTTTVQWESLAGQPRIDIQSFDGILADTESATIRFEFFDLDSDVDTLLNGDPGNRVAANFTAVIGDLDATPSRTESVAAPLDSITGYTVDRDTILEISKTEIPGSVLATGTADDEGDVIIPPDSIRFNYLQQSEFILELRTTNREAGFQIDLQNGLLYPNPETTAVSGVDSDGDGLNDSVDIDSDNDGIPDNIEAQATGSYRAPTGTDADGNGLDDGYETTPGSGEGLTPIDSDGGTSDGTGTQSLPNYLDTDADDDGISDVEENGIDTAIAPGDADGDGLLDVFERSDINDGFDPNDEIDALLNGLLPDSDGDATAGTTLASGLDYLDNNASPTARDNVVSLPEDTLISGNVITDDDPVNGLDGDDDNDPFTLTSARVDSDGDGIEEPLPLGVTTTITDGVTTVGRLTLDSTGAYTFTPTENFNGTVPAVTYTLSDSTGSTSAALSITVTPVNDPPVAVDDAYTTFEDAALVVPAIAGVLNNGTGNDVDIDGTPLSTIPGTRPTTQGGTVTITADGGFTYTPALNYSGIDSFDYEVLDGNGGSDSGTVTLTVNPDADGDGVSDAEDPDADNDGIPDAVEDNGDPTRDTDGDGLVDSLDLDSDGDGIPDSIEAGGEDADGNGQIGTGPVIDADGDGIPDIVDNVDSGSGAGEVTAGTPLTPVNTDATGNPDFQDIDADDDGIPDLVESQPTADYTAPETIDTDGDGLDDAFDPDQGGAAIAPVNTDGVDAPDYQDLDSDNDGTPDQQESGNADAPIGTDSDGDGLDDGFTNGITDPAIDLPNTDGIGDVDYRDTSPSGVIINEWSQGSNGGKEWVELLITRDGTNLQNAVLADTNRGMARLQLSGPGFADLPAGTFLVIYNGNDPDDAFDPDLTLDPASGDFRLLIPSTNATGDFAITAAPSTTGGNAWNPGAGGAFGNNNGGDMPVLMRPDSGFFSADNTPVTYTEVNALATFYGALPFNAANQGTPDPPSVGSIGANGNFHYLGSDETGIVTDANWSRDTNNGAANGNSRTPGEPNAQVIITQSDGSTDVAEGGATDTYRVVLRSQPTAEVTVTATPDAQTDLGNGAGAPIDIVFTPADWFTPQVVTVTAVDDLVIEDTPHPSQISHQVVSQNTDSLYNSANGVPIVVNGETGSTGEVSVAIADNDVDTDGDGILDGVDLDDDNDGIVDTAEQQGDPTRDTDGDGILDQLDLDSDGDGIPDVIEAGHGAADADGDGLLDGDPAAFGTNGLLDDLETAPDSGTLVSSPVDTDENSIANFQELDSDGDGSPDRTEAGLPIGPGTPDADGDGKVDDLTDSDSDGIPDTIDSQPGSYGGFEDTDNDGIPNLVDLDDDNDGIADTVEQAGDPLRDTDADGVVNSLDLDADNDGIADAVEAQPTVGYISLADLQDTNGANAPSLVTPVDTDADGVADYLDSDSDNDTLPDSDESGLTLSGIDANGDGIDDDLSIGASYADSDGVVNNPINTLTNDDSQLSDVDFRSVNNEAPVAEDDAFITSEDSALTGNVLAVNPTASDRDPENDPLTVIEINGSATDIGLPVTLASGVIVVLNADGTYSYTPNGQFDTLADGETATDTFTYTLSDGNGGTDTATVTITINGASNLPIVVDDTYQVTEDVPLTVDAIAGVLNNDSNDALSVTPDTIPTAQGGTVNLNADGSFVYTPPVDYAGPDSFDYDVINASGGSDTGTVVFTIAPDNDGDTTPDDLDLDDDNDGIVDTAEQQGDPTRDTDGDGILDQFDLDADNDSIPDLYESGVDDAQLSVLDANRDGQIDLGTAFGANGFADTLETSPESGQADYNGDGTPDIPVDTDGAVADFQDLDADGDGIPDITEATVGGNPDANGDGRVDSLDLENGGSLPFLPDTDGDAAADFRDLDADNDGINDLIEAGGPDLDSNGLTDGPDANGDGLADALDPLTGGTPLPLFNSDNDSLADFRDPDTIVADIPDEVEEVPPPAPETSNTDGDGQVDNPIDADSDSDNDGIVDRVDLDDDNDGILDVIEAQGDPNRDSDGDGILDRLDLDADNDGILDIIEAASGADPDGDGRLNGPVGDNGLADSVETTPESGTRSTAPPDTDNDGIFDFQDLDTDNDGIFDLQEGLGLPDNDGDGRIDSIDSDGDGIVDLIDAEAGFDSTASGFTTLLDDNGNGVPDVLESVGQSRGRGRNVIAGDDGDNIINGFSDRDSLDGGGGDDILNGGSAADQLVGGDGNDVLNGGTNGDRIWGGHGNDILNGGSGNDRMFGGTGRDILNGGAGNDRMFGGTGRDILNGGAGNDRILGDRGRDRLKGDRGNDRLRGGAGRDVLTGGQGRDRFKYQNRRDFGDVITDFEILNDRIDLRQVSGIRSMDDIILNQQGSDAIVRVDGAGGIKTIAVLEDVNAATLADRHFML